MSSNFGWMREGLRERIKIASWKFRCRDFRRARSSEGWSSGVEGVGDG